MNVLFTGDFQAEFSNLDLCERAWQECIDICLEKDLKYIVFLGDGKQVYNPVDTRVILWWQRSIRTAKDNGITVIWLMGNHDRVGQHLDSSNWLPILRRAGAITFSREGIYALGSSRLFLLPYSSNSVATKRINKLVKDHKPDKTKDILCFHHDILGARYNNFGGKSDAALRLRDLRGNLFNYVIGGHIHLPQKIEENGYYVGSPFCQDWGEVNQQKRYIIIRKTKLTSCLSSIPGWFDGSCDGYEQSKPKIWKGTRVRVTVQCDVSENYGRIINRARRRAEKYYRGATITIVPKFKDTVETESSIKYDDTDDRKIKAFVRETCTDSRLSRKVEAYMVEKLGMVSANIRTKAKLKFILAEGTNFLPFKKVKTVFDKGINVIQGVNEDRVKKSNGSGKTSVLQIIPVSMFGRTFKGQTHDAWSNRWRSGKAEAITVLKDYKDRVLTIIRGRRPPLLQMSIDGKDVSSGMKSNDREGTQAQIEKETGFTWQTLANAIYIDRSIADAFLSGTRKQRTELLNRFQNLERFEKALELVKKDYKEWESKILKLDNAQAKLKDVIVGHKTAYNSIKHSNESQVKQVHIAYKNSEQELNKFKLKNVRVLHKLDRQVKKIEHKYDALTVKNAHLEKDSVLSLQALRNEKANLVKYKSLLHSKECPTCHGPVPKKWLKDNIKDIVSSIRKFQSILAVTGNALTKYRLKIQLLDGKHGEINTKINKIEREQELLSATMQTRKEQWLEINSSTHESKTHLYKIKKKIKYHTRERKHYLKKLKHYEGKDKILEFAIKAFSRDGIPQFLNRQLCPVLNKAADYYAKLFSDREIQVKFIIEGGDIIPIVINVNGGESIDDQSEGERALAGLITSFASREISPRSNLLILDEPGAGLDAQTARQFARSLRVLQKRFGSIWLTSHNQVILSELSGENLITVVKKNKISKIKEN